MKYLILAFLVVLPLFVGATTVLNIQQVSATIVEYNYWMRIMDSDSTLCFYDISSNTLQNRQVKMRRLHANGLLEEEQVIYSFSEGPINFYSSDFRIVENTLYLLFSSTYDIYLLVINGSQVQSYTIPFDSYSYTLLIYRYLFMDNKLFFLSYDPFDTDKLWCWDYYNNELTFMYSCDPEAMHCSISPLSQGRILLSQTSQWSNSPPPPIIFDSEFNPTVINAPHGRISVTYCFDDDNYYANWSDEYGNNYEGIITLNGTEITEHIWLSTSMYDPWGDGWYFGYRLPGNRFTARYSFDGMYSSYSYYRIFQYYGNGQFAIYTGFPQIDDFPYPARNVVKIRNNLLSLHPNEGQLYFRLADLDTEEWAVVQNNPWQSPTGELSDYYFILNSNSYIFVAKSYSSTSHIYYCLKLDVSVSIDDPQAPDPAFKAWPNPFGDKLTLEYKNNIPGNVSVKVYNMRGQLVKSIYEGSKSANDLILNWDGKDESGNAIATGVYFIRSESCGKTETRKIMRVK